ncbi:MAG: sulfite exporter TauE/SafE family protein [Bacteroidales bacterium]|nr:sulfite exporter TauE/SafE family protein [Bacteroidales bacterium]
MFEIIIIIVGILAGTLGGLLGIGGGIILMPVLIFYAGLSPAHAAGTCVMAVFFTTIGGTYRHYKVGHIDFKSIYPIIISGIIFTSLFSWIFIYFTKNESWLLLAMGIVFSLVSLRMLLVGFSILKIKKDNGKEIKGPIIGKSVIGAVAGILPGLLGIGTGTILVPSFSFILQAPIKIAMGASLACFAANSLISTAFKFSQGFVLLEIAIPISIGTLIGSYFGASLNKKFSSSVLTIFFGLIFTFISIKFILSFWGIKF